MEMSRIEISLNHLEARLRAMIEGDAAKGGIPRKLHNQVLHALLQAMLAEVYLNQRRDDQDGRFFVAPDQYTIVISAVQANILINHPVALDKLVQKMESAAAQANLRLAGSPMLRVVPDPNVKELQILAEYSHTGMRDSYTTEMDGMPVRSKISTDGKMPNAFLIVNGLSTYPLTQPVINIGCDPTNHLVLDAPSVSRLHAQLRFIIDRFVIFDLDSKQGTFVNGTAVSSHVLNPGDVILLAGVPLVYGLEATTQLGYTQELPVEPPAPEIL
jgi:hypothetical protein